MEHNAKYWIGKLVAAISMLLLVGVPAFLLFLFGSFGTDRVGWHRS